MIKNVEESDEDIYTCRAVVYETGELAERIIKLEVNMIKIYFLYVVQDSVVNICYIFRFTQHQRWNSVTQRLSSKREIQPRLLAKPEASLCRLTNGLKNRPVR